VKQTFIKKCSTIEFIIGAIAPVLIHYVLAFLVLFCNDLFSVLLIK